MLYRVKFTNRVPETDGSVGFRWYGKKEDAQAERKVFLTGPLSVIRERSAEITALPLPRDKQAWLALLNQYAAGD